MKNPFLVGSFWLTAIAVATTTSLAGSNQERLPLIHLKIWGPNIHNPTGEEETSIIFEDILKWVLPDGTFSRTTPPDHKQYPLTLDLSPATLQQKDQWEYARELLEGRLGRRIGFDREEIRREVAEQVKNLPNKPDSPLTLMLRIERVSETNLPKGETSLYWFWYFYLDSGYKYSGGWFENRMLSLYRKASPSLLSFSPRSWSLEYDDIRKVLEKANRFIPETARQYRLNEFAKRLPQNETEWEEYRRFMRENGLNMEEAEPVFLGPLMQLDWARPPSTNDLLESDNLFRRAIRNQPRDNPWQLKEVHADSPMRLFTDRGPYHFVRADGSTLPSNKEHHFPLALPFYQGAAPVAQYVPTGRMIPLSPHEQKLRQQNGLGPATSYPEKKLRWYLINESGQKIGKENWQEMYPFTGGVALVLLDDDTYAFVTPQGTRTSKDSWEFLTSAYDGVAFAGRYADVDVSVTGLYDFIAELDDIQVKLVNVHGQVLANPSFQAVAMYPDGYWRLIPLGVDDSTTSTEPTELGHMWWDQSISHPKFPAQYYRRVRFPGDPAKEASTLAKLAYDLYSRPQYGRLYWPERVEWMFERATRLDPKNPYIQKMYGWSLINLGFDLQALALFQAAAELAGELTDDILVGMVIVQWHLGNLPEARRLYRDLIQRDSDFADSTWLENLSWPDRETAPLFILQKEVKP